MAVAKTKINKVFVIGTVTEIATNINTSASGKTYMNGKIVVKSTIDNEEILTEFKVLAFEKTKDGSDNKIYQNYLKLDSFLNKKAKITGELREGSVLDQTKGTLNKFNELYLKFCNVASSADVDCSTFEFSGFVVKGLYERKNKEESVIGHRIEIAQTNYNDSNIQVLKFDIDAKDVNIIQAIESNYIPGSTVQFNGTIRYSSRTETKIEEVTFGDPVVKSYVITDKSFRIQGGKEPFGTEDPTAYSTVEIKKYIDAYKKADVDKIENIKNKNNDGAEDAPAINSAMNKMTRTSSLI